MDKYLHVAKITFLNQLVYRTRFFTPLLFDGTALLISVVLWKAIYQGKEVIQGYAFSPMATYYALNMAMARLKTRSATGIVGDDVKEIYDRVIIINHGSLVYDASLGELTKKYADYKLLIPIFNG